MTNPSIWKLYAGKSVYLPQHLAAQFLIDLGKSDLFGWNAKIKVNSVDKGIVIKHVATKTN